MQPATKKLARAIASQLRDIDKQSPVKQMAIYFATGRKLQEMLGDEGTYGATAIKDTVECVPQLRDENRAYEIMSLSGQGITFKKFVLEQTAIPMSNGQHLTLGHWIWLVWHHPTEDPREQKKWLHGELAWLRRESPSASVIEHIEGVLKQDSLRERELAEKRVQEAIRLLETL